MIKLIVFVKPCHCLKYCIQICVFYHVAVLVQFHLSIFNSVNTTFSLLLSIHTSEGSVHGNRAAAALMHCFCGQQPFSCCHVSLTSKTAQSHKHLDLTAWYWSLQLQQGRRSYNQSTTNTDMFKMYITMDRKRVNSHTNIKIPFIIVISPI